MLNSAGLLALIGLAVLSLVTAGYFFGKDRRGQLHRVPLMTVSIGVVTNERRRFTHAAQVHKRADRTADAGKSSASRQTFVSGNAARAAGADLRRRLLEHG